VQKFVPHLEAMKVAVDGSCGIAGRVLPYVLEKLPLEVIGAHFDAEGRKEILGKRFPSPEAQDALKQAVRSNDARFGAAIDFDGDLVTFCDETGTMLRNDVAATLVAKEILSRTPGARIAYDLRFTGAMREEIVTAGGQPLRSRADSVALAAALRQKEAAYAADAVGRHFFRDLYGAESPILALMMMGSLLSRTQQNLSELGAGVMRYHHSGEITYEMPSAEEAEQFMEGLRAKLPEAECDTLDGLTFRFPEWWFNLRGAADSPLLRLNVEGRAAAEERRGRQSIDRMLRKQGARKVT